MTKRILYTWGEGWGWQLVGDNWSVKVTGFWTPVGAWLDCRRERKARS